jgi:hypothetical protein
LELIPAVAAHSVQFLVLNPQNLSRPELHRIFSDPESRQTGDGRSVVKDFLRKYNTGVVNDLLRLWFFGSVVKGVVTLFRYARISAVSLAAP